jgi:branched-chain amino acid transport system permease protein
MSPLTVQILTLTLIYGVVILGLNVIAGYAGVFSVAQGSLFGVGAFTYAGCDRILHVHELWVVWPIAALVGLGVSISIGLVSLRVAGDFFVIASFGMQTVLMQAAFNWEKVSGGPTGAFGLAAPTVFGREVIEPDSLMILAAVFSAAMYAVTAGVVRAPFGRLMRAMRDDEEALNAAGFNTRRLRISAFTYGGVLATLAGSVYAAYLGVAQTGDFTVTLSILLFAAVIVGGAGTLLGSIIGALLFIGAPQLLNMLDVSASLAGSLQQLAFGVLVIVVMFFLRGGGVVQILQVPVRALADRTKASSAKSTSGPMGDK